MVKPPGSRRRRKRNRSNMKRKLSIRKKSGGKDITIYVYDRDPNVPVRLSSLNIKDEKDEKDEKDKPLQMSALKELLLNEYHSISSISTVRCMIEEHMGDGPESYISYQTTIIKNDTDKIPDKTCKIEIHTDDYKKVNDDDMIYSILTNDQYSVDNTNYTLTIEIETIQKIYKQLTLKNIQFNTKVFTEITNIENGKTMVSKAMYFKNYQNVFTINKEADLPDQVNLSAANNIQIKLCFVLT